MGRLPPAEACASLSGMSQRQRIVIAQQQRLALNSSLHTAIRLLRSDTAGLTRYLEEQAAENPHLRLIPPEAPGLGDWLPRWSGLLGPAPGGSPGSGGGFGAGIGAGFGAGIGVAESASAQPSLVAHALAAIRALDLPRADQRIALALVEALEPSGWLGRSVAAIAQDLGLTEAAVEAVLARVQEMEPAGLFARNLAECLALQARDMGRLDREMQVILDHLDLLAAGQTERLARLCGCEAAGVVQRFRLIRAMNPKPGTQFSGPSPALGREPDLLARQDAAGRWGLSLNRSALPTLAVEPRAEAGAEGGDQTAREQRAAAKALCSLVRARNDTLLRVGEEIVARQSAALIEGPGALRPMSMADLAEALGLHVSTISRVVAGASMDSPYGLWWLRRMFSGARGPGARAGSAGGSETMRVEGAGVEGAEVQGAGGPVLSAAALRHHLGRIVASEAAQAPLTDAALAERLEAETGVRLARRTVAQYREAEKIPPAHRRRRPVGRAARRYVGRDRAAKDQPAKDPPAKDPPAKDPAEPSG